MPEHTGDKKPRPWWRSEVLDREIVPALLFGFFVYFASNDWQWAVTAGWGFGVILSRIEDLKESCGD